MVKMQNLSKVPCCCHSVSSASALPPSLPFSTHCSSASVEAASQQRAWHRVIHPSNSLTEALSPAFKPAYHTATAIPSPFLHHVGASSRTELHSP